MAKLPTKPTSTTLTRAGARDFHGRAVGVTTKIFRKSICFPFEILILSLSPILSPHSRESPLQILFDTASL
ncbi:hypothetical protein A0128_02845 [Leptospira tipperaryensis]|uniref:Uncharacterized protein n=1 Tax=Leptospira tipperaryensis TaxID=2564040 RepID=A0A1D7UTL0_9LEPT|nr:hypothetical protein A0128_02845 [Leptospira tipperaryensis]